jgi:putative ABC transport system permease protein
MVSFIFLKCATQADLDHFRQAIDDFFARSTYETKTQDEKAFMNEFIKQQFDLPRNLTILVTVFVAIMAAANTMSMNFRDRLGEFAALKSLGFGGRFVFWLIQSESMLLCAAGGLVGAALPYLAFTYTPLKDVTVPLIQYLVVPLETGAKAVLIALGIGVLAAVWPAWLALRLRVVEALRRLE